MSALCKQAHNENDPLAVFIAKAGGINPEYAQGMRQGELRRIRELRRGLPPGAINRNASLTLEQMVERAHEEGFIVEPDMDHFFEVLEKDVNACAVGDHTARVYRLYSQAAIAAWEAQYEGWSEEQEANAGLVADDDCPFDVPALEEEGSIGGESQPSADQVVATPLTVRCPSQIQKNFLLRLLVALSSWLFSWYIFASYRQKRYIRYGLTNTRIYRRAGPQGFSPSRRVLFSCCRTAQVCRKNDRALHPAISRTEGSSRAVSGRTCRHCRAGPGH